MLISLRGDRPLYQQIFDAIQDAIITGELREGARLPSSRALADELGVSRNVVLLAYDNLYAEGYIRTRGGSGTFVDPVDMREERTARERGLPTLEQSTLSAVKLSSYGERLAAQRSLDPFWRSEDLPTKPRFDFRYGHPSIDLFPFDTWRRLLQRHIASREVATWGYSLPSGLQVLRAATADYLGRSRNVVCEPENVIIVSGSQQGIDLTARLLVNPGDTAVVEEPCYPGARAVLHALGAEVIPVPVDDQGLDVQRLEPLGHVRLVIVTPSHHYPTGAIMSLERRLALAEWADRTGAYVLEDDYDSEFRYGSKPVESLQGLHPNGPIIYLGTFSKVLVPALRVGYVVIPTNLADAFVSAKAIADRHTPVLSQLALADFINDGHFEHHLRRARVQNESRRKALIEALHEAFGGDVEISGASAGVHLLAWLDGLSKNELETGLARAAQAGVVAYSVASCYRRPVQRAGLVLGYASMAENELHAGVALLAEALADAQNTAAPPDIAASTGPIDQSSSGSRGATPRPP